MGEVLRRLLGERWLLLQPLPSPGRQCVQCENTFHSVYFHKVGTPQDQDELVFRNDNEPNRYHFAGATEDGRYVVLNTSTGTDGNALHVMDREADNPAWLPLVEGFKHHSSLVEHVEGKLYVLTDIGAPRYRLVAADPPRPRTNPCGKTCSQNRTTCWSR